MSARNGFAVTYDVVTPESAEHGDTADSGFVVDNVSLRDAIAALQGAQVAPSCEPFNPRYAYTWFYTLDADVDYRTGAETRRALHLPASLTPATRRRIARLLGVRS